MTPPFPLYREPLRPQFHFTARYWDAYQLNPQAHEEGWINDVNGLVYLDGVYHFFAQRWWSCWLHAVSRDLIHWEELPPAFGKDETFGGTQSGGAVIDYHNTSGLATGDIPVMIAFWSSTDNRRQCISYSNDRGQTWTKYAGNPILDHPERDPCVFWHEPTQKWIMILFGPPERSFVLFSSKNLLQWEKHSSIPGLFECPDIFPLALEGDPSRVKWVIVDGDGSYLLGEFDGARFTPDGEKLRCELGPHFYATRTWNNLPQEDRRRIQMAWMRGGEYPDLPFNQQITFPCELSLRALPEGLRLCRNPIREIERLCRHSSAQRDHLLQPGADPLAGAEGELLDVELDLDLSRSTCQRLTLDLRCTRLEYTPADGKLTLSCGSQVMVQPRAGRLHLRALVDRLSVEVFVNRGEVSLTHCVQATASPLSLRAEGGPAVLASLEVRELNSIWEGARG
jgi:sucrose-6-phosphate hydrolase SacC (GH32 family)